MTQMLKDFLLGFWLLFSRVAFPIILLEASMISLGWGVTIIILVSVIIIVFCYFLGIQTREINERKQKR